MKSGAILLRVEPAAPGRVFLPGRGPKEQYKIDHPVAIKKMHCDTQVPGSRPANWDRKGQTNYEFTHQGILSPSH